MGAARRRSQLSGIYSYPEMCCSHWYITNPGLHSRNKQRHRPQAAMYQNRFKPVHKSYLRCGLSVQHHSRDTKKASTPGSLSRSDTATLPCGVSLHVGHQTIQPGFTQVQVLVSSERLRGRANNHERVTASRSLVILSTTSSSVTDWEAQDPPHPKGPDSRSPSCFCALGLAIPRERG